MTEKKNQRLDAAKRLSRLPFNMVSYFNFTGKHELNGLN